MVQLYLGHEPGLIFLGTPYCHTPHKWVYIPSLKSLPRPRSLTLLDSYISRVKIQKFSEVRGSQEGLVVDGSEEMGGWPVTLHRSGVIGVAGWAFVIGTP